MDLIEPEEPLRSPREAPKDAPGGAPGSAPGGAAGTGDRPGRLSVGVVGAGRVGPPLAAALRLAGHRVTAASGVSDTSRRRAAALLPEITLTPRPQDVLAAADLVLLTVPDDALADLVAGLAATGAVRPGQLLAHTSGRYGTSVLEPALRAGALPLALHPVMAFTGTDVDVARLAGCVFGVTAPEQLRPVAEALVVEMGGEPEWVPEEVRGLYHAALAHGSNHLVTLVGQTADALRAAGVADPARMLGPLLGASLDNALRHGDAALTGPVSRGDAGTVRRHVAELGHVAPQTLETYKALARATADRALDAGLLGADAAASLLGALGDGPAGGRGGRAPGGGPGGPQGGGRSRADDGQPADDCQAADGGQAGGGGQAADGRQSADGGQSADVGSAGGRQDADARQCADEYQTADDDAAADTRRGADVHQDADACQHADDSRDTGRRQCADERQDTDEPQDVGGHRNTGARQRADRPRTGDDRNGDDGEEAGR